MWNSLDRKSDNAIPAVFGTHSAMRGLRFRKSENSAKGKVMRARIRALFAATSIHICLGTMHAVAQNIPTDVQSAMKESLSTSRDLCPHNTVGSVVIRHIQYNDSGPSIYLLDYSNIQCDEQHLYCGSAGCTRQIFAKCDACDAYEKVVEETLEGVKFSTSSRGTPEIILERHDSECGTSDDMHDAPCIETLYWDGMNFGHAHR